ncbi:MAG: hypothetical protein ACO3JL_00690 [Myxococcota bacterium]
MDSTSTASVPAPSVPLRSGASPGASPLGGAPVAARGPLAVQLRERLRVDGLHFLQQTLVDAAAQARAGKRVTVVFDLDNTLFDTRARTLAIARRFDAEQGTSWCEGLTLHGVRLDAATTAAALGPPAPPSAWCEAFERYWAEEFWTPANLVHDLPIEATLHWVREAQAAGLIVRYLTGRTTPFQEASLQQLRAAGIEVSPDDVVCKPSVDYATAPFKGDGLHRGAQEGHVAWFLTEGRRDLAHVEAHVADVATVLLECSFEDEGAHAVRPETPRLSRVF